MSFGKIVRKVVKKWLKKENEAEILEPIDFELYDERTLPLSSERCVFCVERDGAHRGDLNRNVHISDEMGFSKDADCSYQKHLDDVRYNVLDSSDYPSSPFHGTTPVISDATELSYDSICHSSRSPVPICVCETCYIFVSSSLPSRISASSRTATPDATADQPFVNDGSECSPFRGHVDVSSKLVSGKFTKSGFTSDEMENSSCYKDSSSSLMSNTRRVHSTSSEKQVGRNTTETICSNLDELPVSVAVSLDGEEGFVSSQRCLRSRNQWCKAAQARFRPPPNKTICHVSKCRDSVIS